MMTLQQAKLAELISAVINAYRDAHPYGFAPMEEWAAGYLCALRDVGTINAEQWEFLIGVYVVQDGKKAE